MQRTNTPGRSSAGRDLFKDKSKKKVKEAEKKTPTAILVGEHGRYQIKSGRLSGEYVARAFPKAPTNTRGLIAEARGATEEAAIAALHDAIDARETQRTGERRNDAQSGMAVPSTEEYVEAIGQVALSGPQVAMLEALSLAGEDGLAEARMARAAGYKSQTSANRSFAGAGLLIAAYLSPDAAGEAATPAIEGSAILGFRGEPRNEDDPGNWVLYPELRKAVRALH